MGKDHLEGVAALIDLVAAQVPTSDGLAGSAPRGLRVRPGLLLAVSDQRANRGPDRCAARHALFRKRRGSRGDGLPTL
eukprot:5914921-Alexandrium_andersonii.AAC.1